MLREEYELGKRGAHHPNIVQMVALAKVDQCAVLLMELCVGEELHNMIEAEVGLPPLQVFCYARQLASALHHLHTAGVVHCDVKPENVIVQMDHRIKLCDFGAATVAGHPLRFRGTVEFMAPETRWHVRPVATCATDLWALGMLVYEALAGRYMCPAGVPQDAAEAQTLRSATNKEEERRRRKKKKDEREREKRKRPKGENDNKKKKKEEEEER